MNAIDYAIVEWLNGFAAKSHAFDVFIWMAASNHLMKSGLLIAMLAWVWFRQDNDTLKNRTTILFGLMASWLAVFLSRVISLVMPFRLRPLGNPDVQFVSPLPLPSANNIIDWSSFPSDNATLFFALAATVYLVSRTAGIIALCQVAVTAGFSRVYLGWHYPSDAVCGAALGIATVYLAGAAVRRNYVTQAPLRWMEHSPQSFAAVLGLLLFLTFMTFEPVYPILHLAVKWAQILF